MANCIIFNGGTWNKDDWAITQRTMGAYRVATELEEAGYSTFILDFVYKFTIEEIKKVLDQHLDDETLWVGFSSTFYWAHPTVISHTGNADAFKLEDDHMFWTDHKDVIELLDYVKANSNAKIVYGGTKSEFFIGTTSKIDYFVTGLADNSVVGLSDYLKTGDVTRLLGATTANTKDGGSTIVIDSTGYPEPSMSQLSTKWWKYPNWHIQHGEALGIEFARGCIFKCKFCTYPLLGKKKGTYIREIAEIRDDLIRNYETCGTIDYAISDDTTNDDMDKMVALHKMITSLPFKPRFTGFFRVDLINRYPEQADLISEMGVVGVFFGIETINPKSAVSIGKGLHPNKVKDRLYWLKEKWKDKVNIGTGFILGLPHDTIEYFEELADWTCNADCPLDDIQFYPLHLNDTSRSDHKGLYVSEFNLHPEIYGYTFPGKDNYVRWELEEQNLSYNFCQQASRNLNVRRARYNKRGSFEMSRYLNIGIPIEDLYRLTHSELVEKHDIAALNTAFVNKYKKAIGL